MRITLPDALREAGGIALCCWVGTAAPGLSDVADIRHVVVGGAERDGPGRKTPRGGEFRVGVGDRLPRSLPRLLQALRLWCAQRVAVVERAQIKLRALLGAFVIPHARRLHPLANGGDAQVEAAAAVAHAVGRAPAREHLVELLPPLDIMMAESRGAPDRIRGLLAVDDVVHHNVNHALVHLCKDELALTILRGIDVIDARGG